MHSGQILLKLYFVLNWTERWYLCEAGQPLNDWMLARKVFKKGVKDLFYLLHVRLWWSKSIHRKIGVPVQLTHSWLMSKITRLNCLHSRSLEKCNYFSKFMIQPTSEHSRWFLYTLGTIVPKCCLFRSLSVNPLNYFASRNALNIKRKQVSNKCLLAFC